jgi:hypothetical protein
MVINDPALPESGTLVDALRSAKVPPLAPVGFMQVAFNARQKEADHWLTPVQPDVVHRGREEAPLVMVRKAQAPGSAVARHVRADTRYTRTYCIPQVVTCIDGDHSLTARNLKLL